MDVEKEAEGTLVLWFCLAQAPDLGTKKVINTSSHCWSQPCENPWEETTWTNSWAQSVLKTQKKSRQKGLFCVLVCVIFGMHCPEVKTLPLLGLSLNIICAVLVLLGVESVTEHSCPPCITSLNKYGSPSSHLYKLPISSQVEMALHAHPTSPSWDFVSFELVQVTATVSSYGQFPCYVHKTLSL